MSALPGDPNKEGTDDPLHSSVSDEELDAWLAGRPGVPHSSGGSPRRHPRSDDAAHGAGPAYPQADYLISPPIEQQVPDRAKWLRWLLIVAFVKLTQWTLIIGCTSAVVWFAVWTTRGMLRSIG